MKEHSAKVYPNQNSFFHNVAAVGKPLTYIFVNSKYLYRHIPNLIMYMVTNILN